MITYVCAIIGYQQYVVLKILVANLYEIQTDVKVHACMMVILIHFILTCYLSQMQTLIDYCAPFNHTASN